MKTFLKILLTLLIWAIVAGVCVGLAILVEEPLEAGLRLFVVVLLLWYGLKLIIWMVKRWRAKQQVQRLINIDDGPKTSTMELFWKNITGRSDFDKHIIEVLKFLRKNALNKGQDPLNAVPWVIHLGHNAKTKNWLNDGDLERPQIHNALLSEHPFVNWYPMNDQLILDVAPELLPKNSAITTDTVELFDSLSKLNRNQVIDSVIFSLDLSLLQDKEAINNEVKRYRQFFELLRSNCGVDAPVNLVLHGLESHPNMDIWLSRLDDKQRQQVLGQRNLHSEIAEALITNCFAELSQHIRISNLEAHSLHGFNLSAAELPASIESLCANVVDATTSLFNSNRFQAAPSLAGVYFTSGSDTTRLFSRRLLQEPWFIWQDSTVFEKQQNHFSIRKVAWYSVCGLFGVMMLSVHQADSNKFHAIYDQYRNKLAEDPSIDNQVNNLAALTELIEELKAFYYGYWFPTSSDPLKITLLQERFVDQLQSNVLMSIDSGFDARMRDVEAASSDSMDTTVDFINIMIRRINFLQAALNGASASDLEAMPAPYDSDYLYAFPEPMLESINQLYIYSIYTYLNNDKESKIKASLNDQRSQLKQLLISSGGNLDWLVDWVNANRAAEDVTLSQYWSMATGTFPDIKVARAYTIEGKAIIDQFIEELSKALQDRELVESWLPRFTATYEQRYFDSWGKFMVGFAEGQNALNSREEWLGTINNLTTARSHYFNLLNDAEFNLAPLAESEASPEWFEFLLYYQDMLALGQDDVQDNSKKNKVLTKLALKFIGATGAVGKAIAGSGKSALKTKKKLDKASGAGPGPDERELRLQDAADELDAYKKAIADVVYSVERRKFSYENINSLYANPDNPGSAGTALGNAIGSIIKLQGMIGKTTPTNAAFWSIYTGPIMLIQEFMMQETACYLDEQWEKDFLTDLDGVPEYKIAEFVYGETGILWQYLDTNLNSFIERKAGAGYRGKRFDGEKIPFQPDFLMFLTQSRDQKSVQQFGEFKLAIESLPTNVDADALLYVSKTRLDIQCGTNLYSFENKNFPREDILSWDQSCGTTSITFNVASRELVKRYDGPQGFLRFLKDFQTGSHHFNIEEFPEHYYALNEFKISQIQANFNINGVNRMVEMLSRKPVAIPRKIAQCLN